MRIVRKSYTNKKWHLFSNKVKERDGFKCVKCGRNGKEVTLQTHHSIYHSGREPWEYLLSECFTLCKGCHAREHGHIEPNTGWTLLSIDDLGDKVGICEKKGCGSEIRYEHYIYHPKFGYKVVGSTCVDFLTDEDKYISREVIKIFNKIVKFVNKSNWRESNTKRGYPFFATIHLGHMIRIYGEKNNYSFQFGIKKVGQRRLEYSDFFSVKDKSFNQMIELSYIALLGNIEKDEHKKEILRGIYRNTKT